ncbi:MAG: von Willebrand factor type A domain-containing protein, partial [Lentisphaerae bacterium]|nr:von Willebrand factor type A domain-containing protein [Lentisphaerota bacterium]
GEDDLAATEILQRDMAPLLGDIPLMGRLFETKGKKAEEEHRRRRELESREEETTGPRFKAFGVNPFFAVKARPFSTFSIDVDTASYTLARNYMLDGLLPPAEAVRTEEFVNFFDYAYKPPSHNTFKVYTQSAPSKFGHGLQLLKIGVKGRRLGREEQRQAVLTFLVDTSGSMNQPDRIGLVKKSLHLLVDKLSPRDLVAIVQYDSHARLVLEHTPVSKRDAIGKIIDALQCGGSTNLEEGMHRAYEIAGRNFVGGGENRVLVLSDGVANLGTSAAGDILSKVEQYRNQGIYCSVFGFGMGTYDDEMLESLANKGDGAYNFIDSEDEAKRVFVDELAATLNTIAADVKIQVEFNPDLVKRYRQMGYENRQLKKEDFRNDAVDAGEVGSGQSVTALYELELGGEPERPTSNIQRPTSKGKDGTIAVVRVRYRRTDTGEVEEIEHVVSVKQALAGFDEAPARFRLAACVAEFGEILRGSPFAAGSDFEDVASALRPVALDLHLDRRVQQLWRMVQGAGGLSRAEN